MGWSGAEFILIFLIMLVVLGPERMAEVAKKLGQLVGYARRMGRNLSYQLEDELELKALRESLPPRVDLEEELGVKDLKKSVQSLANPLKHTDAGDAKAGAPAGKTGASATDSGGSTQAPDAGTAPTADAVAATPEPPAAAETAADPAPATAADPAPATKAAAADGQEAAST